MLMTDSIILYVLKYLIMILERLLKGTANTFSLHLLFSKVINNIVITHMYL